MLLNPHLNPSTIYSINTKTDITIKAAVVKIDININVNSSLIKYNIFNFFHRAKKNTKTGT